VAPLDALIPPFSNIQPVFADPTVGITITKSAPAVVYQGLGGSPVKISYAITLTNPSGDTIGTWSRITDSVPLSTTLDGGAPTFPWLYGALPGGDPYFANSAPVTTTSYVGGFDVDVDSPIQDRTVITNYTYCFSGTVGITPTQFCESTPITTEVRAPDFSLTESWDSASGAVCAGQRLTYTISISNPGGVRTSQLFTVTGIITDPLTIYTGTLSSDATSAGNVITWSIASDNLLANGGNTVTRTFAVSVPTSLANGTYLTNTYTIASPEVAPTQDSWSSSGVTVSRATAAFTRAPTGSVCVSQTITFTDTSSGLPVSWLWSFGDGITSTQQSPTHTYSVANSYTVWLTTTNACGSGVTSDTITVDLSPSASFTATTPVCLGQAMTFTNTGSVGTYLWSFGDGITSTVRSPTPIYGASGSYTVWLTTTNACGSAVTSNTVTVNPLPSVSFTSNSPVNLGETMYFTNTGDTGTYQWNFGDSSSIVTTTNAVTHTYGSSGNYVVWLTTTLGTGCWDTYSATVTVSSGPLSYVYLPIILKNYPPPEPPPTPECPTVEATIGVGDRPRGIAIITTTNRIYVANHDVNSVSVIDGGTNAVVNTIDLGSGSGPTGIAYHPSGLLYVSLAYSDTVAVISATTETVVGTVAVGDNPAGVAVNPVTGKVYVANFRDASTVTDTVSVISGTTVVGTIGVGDAPSQIAVNPNTNLIFVTNHGHGTNYGEEGSSVSVIDGSTDTVTKTIPLVLDVSEPGQGPHGIAVNPNTNEIYVAVIDSHRLVVIDGTNLDARPTYIAPPLDVPIWMVAVNPELNRVYAVGCDEVWVHKVFVWDGDTDTWPTNLNVGTNPKQGVAFNPETGRLYVSNEDSDDVTVIWTCSASGSPPPPPPPPPPEPCYPREETSITMGNDPRGVAYNSGDNLIYVANYSDGTVSVINGATYGVAATISGVAGANGVAYDSEHSLVYVTKRDSAQLAVINASTNTVSQTIPVGSQPHGVAYNPTSHKIYVANYGGNTVTIIDANTMTTTTTISGLSEPAHIAVNHVTNKVYVSNHGSGTVTVIRGTDDAVLPTVSLGSSGPYGIAADTERNLIYAVSIDVPDLNAPNLVTIDGDTDQVKSNQWGRVNIHKTDGSLVPLRVIAVNPYLGPSPGGGHLYITSSSGDTAGDGSHGTDQLLMSRKGWPEGFNIPNPLDVGSRPEEGVAVDLINSRVFVTARDVNRLTVIQDTADHGQLCVETFALDSYIIEPVP